MSTTQETPEGGRLSRLEVTTDYLLREVGDVKSDVRQSRVESREDNRALREDYRALLEAIDRSRQDSRRDFRMLVSIFVGTTIATWALLGTVLVAVL